MSNKPTFIAAISDSASADTLRTFVSLQGWEQHKILEGDIKTATAYLGENTTPDFLLVDITDADSAEETVNSLADNCEPGVRVIVTGTVDCYSFVLKLQEMGVAHYLLKPLTVDSLLKAAEERVTAHAPADADESANKTIISVLGTRGGVGTSTIAAGVSYLASEQYHMATVLLDPDLHFGTSSLYLNIDPGKNLYEALENPDRIDSLFMERVMMRVTDKLQCISGEESYTKNIHYPLNTADILISSIEENHQVIVVDLPRNMDDFSRHVLERSNTIILISDLSIAGLRDTIRLLDVFKELEIKADIQLIANKVGLAASAEMPVKSFEKNLHLTFAHVLPFDTSVMGLSNSGHIANEALMKSKIYPALNAITSTILGEEPNGAHTQSGSLLNKLLKR